MALAKRSAVYNNGLDKKTDLPLYGQTWQPNARMRSWSFFRKKRALLAILALCGIYIFIKFLPTDVPSVGSRIDPRTGQPQGHPVDRTTTSKQPKPGRPAGKVPEQLLDQIYDGPVKFYRLASSLRPHLRKVDDDRDHVVFLLRDLRTAASLVPLACDMANYNRSRVHMAVMTLRENSIEEIMSVSGVEAPDCPIFWHDTRPDYNSQSSFNRQTTVVQAALSHLDAALNPTAVIIDQQQAKDTHFKDAVQSKLDSIRVPLTIVPNNALTSMSWITAMAGQSLSLLNQNQIDIVITPYKQSAGSLLRLLESIQKANYAGLPEPRITIELPQTIDDFALRYLEYFRWPSDRETGQSKLILRRRIDPAQISPAVASLHTLESFYPPSWPLSHVLVLSPDVELAPEYLQYLTYLMLEYKYGIKGRNMTSAMMGIALDLPERALNDKHPFVDQTTSRIGSLLWSQSPSSTATLYFGDKWVELQNWFTLRIQYDPKLEKTVESSVASVSTKHPAWLGQAQELMLARNYYLLYPGFSHDAGLKLATIHTELHQDPEEFARKLKPVLPDRSSSISSISKDDVLTGEEDTGHTHHHVTSDPAISLLALLLGTQRALDREQLPQDFDLPMYSADGRVTDRDTSEMDADMFAEHISLELGGCDTLKDRDERKKGHIEYMFCKGAR